MKYFPLLAFLPLFLTACQDDDSSANLGGIDLTDITYAPISYQVVDPPGFPTMEIPEDNPMTEEGIELGRMLFYDPILSVDSTISCSSCHSLQSAFTDNAKLSLGVNGLMGTRNAIPLINIGYEINGFFWDGRVNTLEEQALHPVEDPVEMADIWDNVEDKLKAHPVYPEYFRKAFGIKNSGEITRDLATKAIAQFERTFVSANSRYDSLVLYNANSTGDFMTVPEVVGHDLFFDPANTNNTPGETGHCDHCHTGPLIASNRYENNGITEVETLNDFPDLGRGAVTGSLIDNGRFRSMSLRNIALTAPYMHDGRFQTLREVVEHYNSGVHYAENIDVFSVVPAEFGGLQLTEEKVDALVAFLHMFTDTTYYDNPAFQNPFE